MSCSSEPVDMDKVLFERAGKYITNDDYHSFFFFNQKVYNGPAYKLHKNGKKKEEGQLSNGLKEGVWNAWNKDGKKWYVGSYSRGQEHGKWVGYHTNGEKKYEGTYEQGFQAGKWVYYNASGKKELEEMYLSCNDACQKSHHPHPCTRKGKVKSEQKF